MQLSQLIGLRGHAAVTYRVFNTYAAFDRADGLLAIGFQA